MKRLTIVLTMLAVSTMLVQGSYAGMDDSLDRRLSDEQSNVFSPGYINATKQRTDQIINQANPNRSFFKRATDYVKAKLGKDVEDDIANLQGKLKRKLYGKANDMSWGLMHKQRSIADVPTKAAVNPISPAKKPVVNLTRVTYNILCKLKLT